MPWAAPLFIGDDPSSLSNPGPQNRAFAGFIDEVSVFNRSLPGSEILNLYKRGLQIGAIPPVVAIQPQSVGLFEGRTARFNILASVKRPSPTSGGKMEATFPTPAISPAPAPRP